MLHSPFMKVQSPQTVWSTRISCEVDSTDGLTKTRYWLKTLLLLYAWCCSNKASLKRGINSACQISRTETNVWSLNCCTHMFLWDLWRFVFVMKQRKRLQLWHHAMYVEGSFQPCKGFIPTTTLILLFTVTTSVCPLTAMHFFKKTFLSVVNAFFLESMIRKTSAALVTSI